MPAEVELQFVEFVRETLYPGREFIALHEPVFDGNERQYVVDTIDSTFVSSVGKYVDRFEQLVADYTGARRCVATVNGTTALQVALHLMGVGVEDEVITSPLTFVATSNAIRHVGAWPAYVDIDTDTLGLSPDALDRFLKKYARRGSGGELRNRQTDRRIAACVPIHIFGIPLRIESVARICSEWEIPLVEDAAESLGSWIGSRHTGLFGHVGTLSFNGNKTITTGGGGMIITDDENLADRVKHVTTTAKVPHKWRYLHDELGFNFRMPNLNAALGCAQFERLDEKLAIKREKAMRYREFFSAAEWQSAGYHFMQELPGSVANHWLNTLICPTEEARDRLLEVSNANGVSTRPAWELMYTLPHLAQSFRDECPNAARMASLVVNLPSSAL